MDRPQEILVDRTSVDIARSFLESDIDAYRALVKYTDEVTVMEHVLRISASAVNYARLISRWIGEEE